MKQLIVVCGPTASGKTSLAIQLAKKLKTEIVSADSRQFYREMNIGTAKPTDQELAEVKHHFINSHSITEHYSAGDYEKDALDLLNQLFQQHQQVILVGGSGLYIKAVIEGFDALPNRNVEIRNQLKQQLNTEGIEQLFSELQQKDPVYASQVNEKNSQRIVRALEVIRSSGQPFSSFRTKNNTKRPFETKTYLIDWDRKQLYERSNLRVDEMILQGLEQEARSLYPQRHLNALQTVGYNEWFGYFDEEISKEEAIRLIKRNTRRYAKRQLTWFRKNDEIIRVPSTDLSSFVEQF